MAFDRNACSTARRGEVVQVLRDWPSGVRLARTAYSLGFIARDAPLTALDEAGLAAVRAARARAEPLTRRDFLERAFAALDTPYGWGDAGGGRDCSRFVMDTLDTFGLPLPRHSGRQALAGTWSIDVADVTDPDEKVRLADRALARGVVLLHFPGHIMMYLGRTLEGTPMAIHAFAEYVEPCERPDGARAERLRTVSTVTVSDLSLGLGTSRRSFAERITKIVVLGAPPPSELVSIATLRLAEPPMRPTECDDSTAIAVFRSPDAPWTGAPLRVIVTASSDPGPTALRLFDPSGAPIATEVHTLGGPPFTYWAEVLRPSPGAWTAVLGDGPTTHACERIRVSHTRPTPTAPLATTAWEPRWSWEDDTENLYAAFVEQLFRFPPDEDLSWDDLQTLLRDRRQNLFFDHLGLGEEEGIRLGPDCADLPYFLRAYFAWKLRLPFGFRQCSRGRAGEPPSCGPLRTNLEPRIATNDVSAFMDFMRAVASGVHSATARTAPNDEETDLYPIALERSALRPGTVFADPYGHLMVVVQWLPQRAARYGVLLAADAQPDGTISRKRFWRGTFLFTPSTTDAGAGFKAWRPLVYDDEAATMTVLTNDELLRSRVHRPFSMAQYRGTSDAFYDRMQALIDPLPLDPARRLDALLDALLEAALRRVESVQNGVDWSAPRGWPRVEMPEGHDIFETSGPWEDYATPSRDLRILVAIDAVVGFPAEVERGPERFGLTAATAAPRLAALRQHLAEGLRARTFEYKRSDASTTRLSLEDLVARARALEVAYNPNDCPEVRWGAPDSGPEAGTCQHRAPREQQARMAEYRAWFAERRRPPREGSREGSRGARDP